MSKIFQLKGGQYEHPNEYKLVGTVRGTTILQPEFGTVIIEGDVIEASTHNTIQKNGVLASKVNVTMESTDTVLVPKDMTIESDLFNELKIILLFETGTTLPSNSFIKLKETNVPIANVNDYIVNANTPLLFLYFDSKFYAYNAGSGTSTGAESLGDLSDVTLTTPTNGQALVYNGTNFVNQTISGGSGTSEEPAGLLEVGSISGTDSYGSVLPWNYTAAKQGKLCTVTFYLNSSLPEIENIQGMKLNFSAMQNAPAFNPSTQYDILPACVYYKCQYNHAYPNNVVQITISSQSLTFEDNQNGIDAKAFFTITYFTD